MASPPVFETEFRLGPRIPLHRRDDPDRPSQIVGSDIPSRITVREEECTSENKNLCEKPVSQSLSLPIVVGIVIPVILALLTFLYFHRRNVARQRKEDQEDPNKGLDFGLDAVPSTGKKSKSKRTSSFFGGEKNPKHNHQISMDMNMSTPYLLPPQVHGSRESLHSLARSIDNNEDPYRPIASYSKDNGSIRSVSRADGAPSIYAGSSRTGTMRSNALPPRQNSLPLRQGSLQSQMPASPPAVLTSDPFSRPNLQGSPPPLSPLGPGPHSPLGPGPHSPLGPGPHSPPRLPHPAASQDPFLSGAELESPANRGGAPYPDDYPGQKQGDLPQLPELPPIPDMDEHAPPPRQTHDDRSPPQELPAEPSSAAAPRLNMPERIASPQQAMIEDVRDLDHQAPRPSIVQEHETPTFNLPAINTGHFDDGLAGPANGPAPAQAGHDTHYYNSDNHHVEQRGPQGQEFADFEFDLRGRRSGEFPARESQFLAAAPQDTKRLSIGLRPLPPDDIMDLEDPEYRANRIRSFYKEYFDDSVGREPPPPMPQAPREWQSGHDDQPPMVPPPRLRPVRSPGPGQPGPAHGQGEPDYYEDYDGNFATPAAPYFDPNTRDFVMPYAQPVHRRAMTPPPRGSRFRGPPPRVMHGSMGGMSQLGPPRSGSAMSGQFGPRPGSSVSSRYGPRPGSSASNMHGGRPMNRKPRPPPQDLTTLPNPAKLKDDSFAIINAADFAPPDTFKDRTRGRSQSPAPERRPYQLNVPIATPLASAFEELPVIPSPYSLRKSGTFTALDFAPPKRFGDADTMSDAGSIRSNRSGISAVQLSAIRNGAGRVSRLPGDTVFTQAQMQDQLKPSWTMRP